MTTLVPRPPYSQEELQKLYPPGLQLEQVQVVLRHGERSPVSPRFQNAGLTPYWPYCSVARQLRSAFMAPAAGAENWDTLTWKRRLETIGKNDIPVIAKGPGGQEDVICLPGETTDKGRATTFALGTRLRTLYVDQLAFMPSILTTTSNMYLRASPIPRALDAVQQSFTGMYPSSARSPTLEPPIFHLRIAVEENLFDQDHGCTRYGMLFKAFAQRTADRWNTSDEMAYMNKKLGKWMPTESPVLKVDSHPRLSGVMDTVNSTRAHGSATKLPSEFYEQKVLDTFDKLASEEWFSGYRENQELRKLGKGQMVGDVAGRMVQAALGKKEEALKFGMTGAHDTTLAGFLVALGAFEGQKWPPFTSHMAIELFSKEGAASSPTDSKAPAAPRTNWFSSLFGGGNVQGTDSQQSSYRQALSSFSAAERETMKNHYVRIRYNDTPVTIPGCRKPGRHLEGVEQGETFCTLEAFKSIADAFTPKNWAVECKQGLDKPTNIDVLQLAGYPEGEGPGDA